MRSKLLSTALVAAVLSIGLPVIAQSSTNPGFKQDMKDAGHSTKNAAKDTGHGVEERHQENLAQDQTRDQEGDPQNRAENRRRRQEGRAQDQSRTVTVEPTDRGIQAHRELSRANDPPHGSLELH